MIIIAAGTGTGTSPHVIATIIIATRCRTGTGT
jgi:hypothetical protein